MTTRLFSCNGPGSVYVCLSWVRPSITRFSRRIIIIIITTTFTSTVCILGFFFSCKNKIFGELINKNRNGSLGCARFDPCPQENNNNNKKIIIRYGNGWRYIARHHHLVGYLRTSVAFIDCLQVRDIPHAADDRSVVFFLDRAQAYHSRGNNGTMAFSLSLSLSLHV